MKTRRLLLPFAHGVDMYALDYAAHFAKNYEAELVVASLLPQPKDARKGIRLEHLQQTRDIQEAIRNKASRYGVPVSFIEVVAGNIVQQINSLVQEQDCEGIILFVREGQGVLLHTHQVKVIMVEAACKLYILRLPAHEGRAALWSMMKEFFHWQAKRHMRQDESWPGDFAPESISEPVASQTSTKKAGLS